MGVDSRDGRVDRPVGALVMWADELIRIYVELREIHGDEMGREECWELAGIICRFKEQQREADLFAAEVMETLVALPTTGWGDLT